MNKNGLTITMIFDASSANYGECCLTRKIQKIDTQNTKKSTSCNKKTSWFNSKRLLLVSQIYHNQEHRKYHLKGVYLSNQMCYCIMSILLTVVRL